MTWDTWPVDLPVMSASMYPPAGQPLHRVEFYRWPVVPVQITAEVRCATAAAVARWRARMAGNARTAPAAPTMGNDEG